ncbi:PITH domain-containing protein [Symbiodinium microadriaticum]|uniref:PITH domain-containing protein n=1 Tax=Symbiodinium microadriaticum TaxID=2951 RepID=A0A1Q9F6V4_SYMMI|nr:PITH domain-containing protein [Symbiodinium microadriaticum]CAE7919526.1 unnamed protein product [Symbiodinium sp. KB8]
MGFGAHSHDAEFPDDDWNLYQHIDLETSVALNAILGGHISSRSQVAAVLRPHERRLERQPWLTSDTDEELLLVLRFTSPVHIRKILVIGGGGEEECSNEDELGGHPSRLRCFVNREEFDFGSLNDVAATQEFDLAVNSEGTAELFTKVSAFTNVTSLALYFPSNHGGLPKTLLRYVGLQGEHTHYKVEAVHAEYELLCQPGEHGHMHGHVEDHGHSHSHGH